MTNLFISLCGHMSIGMYCPGTFLTDYSLMRFAHNKPGEISSMGNHMISNTSTEMSPSLRASKAEPPSALTLNNANYRRYQQYCIVTAVYCNIMEHILLNTIAMDTLIALPSIVRKGIFEYCS